ncbi:putative branched-subunit amino acid permease [Rubricella aquisinus]|uniref:Putative branched-subunit amino acid permease n=1 Tax=Rubricella aquisinus TaxID=2028108 RepID=A0A840WXD1_9RHOB|nr:AzlC family ABC transporter permease [Rubricella aquisinus]MBB5515014.1 putative branched-subunit amino acid permease [Rubricella aquisinus]
MSTPVKKERSALVEGMVDALPFILIVVPFALLFGVAATEAGLSLVETMSMTVLVIAGAAQFTALALMEEQAPTLIVVFTALAVNLRMVLYSASIAPHLGKAKLWQRAVVAYFLVDQSYAMSQIRFDKQPQEPLARKLAYFAGLMIPVAPLWYAGTYVGAVVGEAIPPEFALDFAVPITFLSMVAPMLRSLPHLVAAFVSVAGTLALIWVPYSMGLLIAAVFAMGAGAMTELWMDRRKGAAA